MTSRLTDLLGQYEEGVGSMGCTDLLRRLRDPAPEEAVRTALADRGLIAPAELIDFYGWNDGTAFEGSLPGRRLWFTPPYSFPPLMAAAQKHDRRMASVEAYWDASWWPLLEDAAATYLSAVCLDEPDVSAPVVEYWTETGDEGVGHASLSDFLATTVVELKEDR